MRSRRRVLDRPERFSNTRFQTPQQAAQSAVRFQTESNITESAFIHSVAGSTGALLAFIIVYPLDSIREQIQCSRRGLSIRRQWQVLLRKIQTGGLSSLYNGLQSALLGIGVSWAIFYYCYIFIKMKFIAWKSSSRVSDIDNLLIGLVAGSVASAVSNPLWVVNTRQKLGQTSPGKGVLATVLSIIREEGPEMLFAGLGPSLILLLNPAIQFAVYERLKLSLRRRTEKYKSQRSSPKLDLFFESPGRLDLLSGSNDHPSIPSNRPRIIPDTLVKTGRLTRVSNGMNEILNSSLMFNDNNNSDIPRPRMALMNYAIAGLMAKVFALVMTYPLQVIKSRAHVRTRWDDEYGQVFQEQSLISCLVRLVETEGVSGMYRGLRSKLFVSGITAAIMLSLYEYSVSSLRSLSSWSRRVKKKESASRLK